MIKETTIVDDVDDEGEDDLDDSDVTQCGKIYSLVKQPPYKNLTVDTLINTFGTVNFLSALSDFLRQLLPGITITQEPIP